MPARVRRLSAALLLFASAAPAEDLVPVNLALNKSATASSSQGGRDAKFGNDGNADSRWCANGSVKGSWWQVDLGSPQDVTGCRVVWEQGGQPYQYKVDGSTDGEKWATLIDKTKNDVAGQVQEHKFAAKVRFVRVTVTGLPEGGWPSFFEFEVQGKELVKAPANRLATTTPGLAGVQAPSGFDVTLFAAPPDVSYPTCLAAAPDGTLFVGVDLNGSLGRKAGSGKIVRCRDTDGDGKADEFVTFTPVESPRGLWWDGKKTLVVLHPPEITAFTDDDGDGKADRKETLVTGLGFDLKFRGADHTTNGFRVGIDGWLYVAVGDYGAVKAVGKDGRTLQYRGGGVVRVRTDGTGLEVVSRGQRNIYDVAVSPTLDLFTRDNTNDGDGWNVRLSHVVPTGHYGYPTLFKKFADEIIEPLADYGGGSPCGALFLDEPGYPEALGHALYTVEWGRGGVFRHPLTAAGASFTAKEEKFLTLPRPTDMDADGVGHLYVSSWKDGGFDFSKPDVGFVVRVTPPGHKPTTFPDLAKAADADLLKFLASPSGVLRFYASREILARGAKPGTADALESVAAGDSPLSTRVAAVFTLRQLLGTKANDALARLAKGPAVREFALRAMTDDPATAGDAPLSLFLDAAKDANPRVRAAAAIGLGRIGKLAAADALLAMASEADPVVAHVATNSLVSLKAADVCLKALDTDAGTATKAAALRVLRQLHEPAAVDGLLARVGKPDEAVRRGVLVALARLYQKEAEWDGKWWSTRPDTTGPYYKPVTWAASAKIAPVLTKALADADAETSRWLVPELVRNRVDLPEVTAAAVKLAESDAAFRPTAVKLLAARGTPPDAAVPLFGTVAQDTNAPADARAAAVRGLFKLGSEPARAAVLAALTADAARPKELQSVWDDFARDGKHVGDVPRFAALLKSGTPAQKELALAVLATVADRPLGAKDARAAADAAVQAALADPAAAPLALKAVGRMNLASFAPQVRRLADSPDKKVAAAAADAIKAMKLDKTAAAGPPIGKLKYDDVLAAAVKDKGAADLGAKLFTRVGCANCHTISVNEPLKGPLLAGITTRYSRAELVESILKPSAKIAQGFETFTFALLDGKSVTGFVVRESGTEVEVRDATGATLVIKKDDIDEKKHGKLSVMPDGLADHLTPGELASLLAYLETLKQTK